MPRVVVYLRFPRNRNGFQDPPPVEWDSHKERQLWSMLKNTTTDLEWHELAAHFGVSLVYILQQAAWLYEKELGALRKRMSKISTSLPHSSSSTNTAAETSHQHQHQLQLQLQLQQMLPSNDNTLRQLSNEPTTTSNSLNNSLDSTLDTTQNFSTRRLLSNSRILASDNDSDFSDDSFDGFLPSNEVQESTSSSDSDVSQSALEAALMEQELGEEESSNQQQ